MYILGCMRCSDILNVAIWRQTDLIQRLPLSQSIGYNTKLCDHDLSLGEGINFIQIMLSCYPAVWLSQGSVGKCGIRRKGSAYGSHKTLFEIVLECIQKGGGWEWCKQNKSGVRHLTFREWPVCYIALERSTLLPPFLFPFLEVESSVETVLVLMS